MRLAFWIAGHVVPQPRSRFRSVTTREGRNIGVAYTPRDARVRTWRDCVMLAAQAHLQPTPLEGPLLVSIAFFFERPQRLMRKCDPDHPIPYDVRPDRDNSEKAVLDALSNVGLWRDDCQATCGGISKWYVAKQGRPGAFIVVQSIGDQAWFSCTDQAVYEVRDRGGMMGHVQSELPGVGAGGSPVDHVLAAVGGRPGEPVDR